MLAAGLPQAYLERRGFQTGAGPAAEAQLPRDGRVVQLHYDAVVVGSGPGGGVTAALLSAAGMRVLVLEKSGWVRRKGEKPPVGLSTSLNDEMFQEQQCLQSFAPHPRRVACLAAA